MAGFGFQGRYRLKKTDDFSSVFRFRKRYSANYLMAYYMPTAFGYPRLGLVVEKKIARRSAQRNYMKRVLRELFRLEHIQLGSVDLVMWPRKAFHRQEFSAIRSEFMNIIRWVRKQTTRSETSLCPDS